VLIVANCVLVSSKRLEVDDVIFHLLDLL